MIIVSNLLLLNNLNYLIKFLIINILLIMIARGGIRTHEELTQDLKTCPFDRSGTLAFLNGPSGARTHDFCVISTALWPTEL